MLSGCKDNIYPYFHKLFIVFDILIINLYKRLNMKFNFPKFLFIFLGIVLLLFAAVYLSNKSNDGINVNKVKSENTYTADTHSIITNKENFNKKNDKIPFYVSKTLTYIRLHNKAPEGYVGGRRFQNREHRLPTHTDNNKIIYREWDVYPLVKGRNRGAERLITSDKSAYYTKDHYKTFITIKEN